MRNKKIANRIGELVSELAIEHVNQIENYAAQSADEDSDKPVVAKLAAQITWEAGSDNPVINVALRYSLAIKDETSKPLDDSQLNMKFVEGQE